MTRRAERVLIPLLDVLQSVPVLGFLSVTVTLFIALFPGSLLGLEAASIFAIFTSQVWNMTFSFYHSLRSLPRELEEAAVMDGCNSFQVLTRVMLPAIVPAIITVALFAFITSWNEFLAA